MFNLYGVIIISIVSLVAIIFIFILGKHFNIIRIPKFLELKKDNNNAELKLKVIEFDKKTKELQIDFALNIFDGMKQHVIDLLKTTSKEVSEEITERGYSYFLIVLDNIFLKMESLYKKDLKIFNFENANEEELSYFKKDRINSIPNKIKAIIPIATMLNHKLSCCFLNKFSEIYNDEYAPGIESVINNTRKLALKNKLKKQSLIKDK